MKKTPRTLTAQFSQRPSSRLKPHAHVFRLRKVFAVEWIKARISRATRLLDLHKLFGQYSVEVQIGALPFRWMLGDISMVSYYPSTWRTGLGYSAHSDRRIIPAAKNITVRLICPDPKLCQLPQLMARKEGGSGFTIAIEIRGSTLWPETGVTGAGARRRENPKRSATRNR